MVAHLQQQTLGGAHVDLRAYRKHAGKQSVLTLVCVQGTELDPQKLPKQHLEDIVSCSRMQCKETDVCQSDLAQQIFKCVV